MMGLAMRSQPIHFRSPDAYRGLSLDPDHSDLHYNLANLTSNTDFQFSFHHYLSSLDSDSTNSNVWHNLGILLNSNHCYSNALTVLRRSISIDPLNSDTWCNLGL